MFLKFLTLRQLSPEPGSGGYSLDDIESDEEETNEDGTPKVPATDGPLEEIDEKPKEEPKKTEEPKKEPEEVKTPEPVKEEPKKEEPKKEPETPAGDDEEFDTEAEDFFKELDELRGESLDVDYGDVDPLSPQGVYLREQAIEENAAAKFEKELETRYPKAYAYLLHAQEGGSDESFFETVGKGNLPTEEELETSVEIQKEVLIRHLTNQGLKEKTINNLVKAAIADDDLEEQAKEALASEAEAEAKKLELVKQNAAKEQGIKESMLKQMGEVIGNVVSSGKIDNIVIPEADRKAFAAEFGKRVRYSDGKFSLVTELSDDNIMAVFKKEFFDFKKGDLKELVEKAAKTENAKRLRRTIGTDKRIKGTVPADNAGNTFGDVE